MRVALVCPYAWDRPGGVQTHVRYLARALRTRGHEAMVVAPRWAAEDVEEEGVATIGRAIRLPANGSTAALALSPVPGALVRRAIRKVEPDVIHVHEPFLPSLSLYAALRPCAPVVATFHAAYDRNFFYEHGRAVLDRLARTIAVRTAVSDAARETAKRYFPGEYLLTPNGVDVARFSSAKELRVGDGKMVLFLNRIEKRKGLLVLIRAMAALQGTGAHLVVAGTGHEEDEARKTAQELGVRATFLGRVPDDLVPRLMRSASVYVAPALFGESFGIVLIEAMAAGTPVVCSDLPGFRAVAGAAAELVEPGDEDALAKTLHSVLTDDAHAQEMARRSAMFASAYDWGRLVGGVERAYEMATSGAALSA